MSSTVILVHGLWMSGFELGVLRHRLNAEYGFNALAFSYHSVTETMVDHVRRLREFAQQQTSDEVHFVGHSMGGIVVMNLLEATQDLKPGRAVLLGSPVCGSRAAEGLARWPVGRVLIGHALDHVSPSHTVRHWDGRRDVGVIAGSSAMGLGRFFTQLDGDHDGTVLVEETQLEGAADRIVMPVTHTGMVFSAEVAQEVANFLRTGKFAGNRQQATGDR
jgi:pimeloyl-ACP methyl ester carboxylesterase